MAEENECSNNTKECRICHGDEEQQDIIEACSCKGSMRWTHKKCLREWQLSVLRQEKTNERRHFECSACKEVYCLKPPSKTAILTEKVGPEFAGELRGGATLVASESLSFTGTPLSESIPLPIRTIIELKRAHWVKGLYFIFSLPTSEPNSLDADDDHVCGLNLTRVMDGSREKPIPDKILSLREQIPMLNILHHNGGPVEWGSTIMSLCAISPNIDSIFQPAGQSPVHIFQTDSEQNWTIIISPVDIGVEVARSALSSDEHGLFQNTLFTFSGFARWTRSQLLQECVRGSWHILPFGLSCSSLVRPDQPDRSSLWSISLIEQCVQPKPNV